MQFDSLLFLIFFTTILFSYYALPSWRAQKLLLLIGSYIFYAALSPPLVILIWVSTIADFILARHIYQTEPIKLRRFLLGLSLSINLGLLGYFKYAQFLLDSFQSLLKLLDIVYQAPELGIILPIGISFYTFQTLSYTIDIYRGRMRPDNSFLDFALYVTFFPQLVAGPIVRANHFLPQCKAPKRATSDMFFWGLSLFIYGIFAKMVLSDFILAPVVDIVYASPNSYGWFDAWTAVFAFSGQIYFDFSGYSLCAIGAAMCFGFHLPDNFRSPYASIGFSDFWKRWHISLSSWLRDYLYVSLGGSKRGTKRTLMSLAVTMLLGGLWHGAAWTFAIWGGIHALLLITEHLFQYSFKKVPEQLSVQLLLMLSTFIIISLTWIPFRAQGIDNLFALIAALFRSDATKFIDPTSTNTVFIITVSMLLWHVINRKTTFEETFSYFPPYIKAAVLAVVLVSSVLCSTGDSRAFIYFQF